MRKEKGGEVWDRQYHSPDPFVGVLVSALV